jgi:hypothetical protein
VLRYSRGCGRTNGGECVTIITNEYAPGGWWKIPGFIVYRLKEERLQVPGPSCRWPLQLLVMARPSAV